MAPGRQQLTYPIKRWPSLYLASAGLPLTAPRLTAATPTPSSGGDAGSLGSVARQRYSAAVRRRRHRTPDSGQSGLRRPPAVGVGVGVTSRLSPSGAGRLRPLVRLPGRTRGRRGVAAARPEIRRPNGQAPQAPRPLRELGGAAGRHRFLARVPLRPRSAAEGFALQQRNLKLFGVEGITLSDESQRRARGVGGRAESGIPGRVRRPGQHARRVPDPPGSPESARKRRGVPPGIA